ncbi:LodA/GoxA family CTQ-dependent oxidase [Flavobacterium sp. SLB02]|jgi:hypothetical protein|uniref:LodA/GoxA family CTQ-dependent oxidase n=1 Tax=Flavobacterium sp. SLB02 TaxID=2665645 RepID=UPI0012A826FD|nr:LodA/GoxA family CTQ-dependent oxidase [Flavobacterium sp. SLB02]QGK75276.1 hypothetical protein GIY83_14680 [Flavobacterium sp. SLB02]
MENVKYLKIHPAIGVARLANNTDFFEFFEAYSRNFSPPEDFMSKGGANDPDPGKLRMKKQAVQFKVFAYDNNNNLLGEVKDVIPGAKISWSASVGNRKLLNYSSKLGGTPIKSVTAKGTASDLGDIVALNGVSPWDANTAVNLGYIFGTGLFVPAKGGVTRKSATSPIDAYPANQNGRLETTDTTCDGTISVEVFDEAGNKVDVQVIAAWIVSAPAQHSLTLSPAKAQEMADNFGSFKPANSNNNTGWVESTKSLLGITGIIDDPTGLDLPMMLTMNADYNPGMEVNIGDDPDRIENGIDSRNFFYPRGAGFIGNNEIRIQPEAPQANGTIPGQITSGLCSTWQGDMSACLNYWTAENPNSAFGPPPGGQQVLKVIYKEGNPNVVMNNPEEINQFMDFRGIVGNKRDGDDITFNLEYDPNRP